MNRLLMVVGGLFVTATTTTSSLASECNCRSYPFSPSPPCTEQCFRNLVHSGQSAIENVSNLDPGVKGHLLILSEEYDGGAEIRFDGIEGKAELEEATLEVLKDRRGYDAYSGEREH